MTRERQWLTPMLVICAVLEVLSAICVSIWYAVSIAGSKLDAWNRTHQTSIVLYIACLCAISVGLSIASWPLTGGKMRTVLVGASIATFLITGLVLSVSE